MLKLERGEWTHYTGEEGKVALVTLFYRKGRGIYVTIQEVTLKHENGFTSMSFTVFQNNHMSALLVPMVRGNPHKLAKVAALLNTRLDEVLKLYADGRGVVEVTQPFVDALNRGV